MVSPFKAMRFSTPTSTRKGFFSSTAMPDSDSGSWMSILRVKSTNEVETIKKMRSRKTTSMSEVSWRL